MAKVTQYTRSHGRTQRVVQNSGLTLEEAKQQAIEYADTEDHMGESETSVYVVFVRGIPVARYPEEMRDWELAY